jgi:G:T/U-mismatch repair DNA glycosylase
VIPVLPSLSCSLCRLPSTSPANARFTLQRHLDAWQLICGDDPARQRV